MASMPESCATHFSPRAALHSLMLYLYLLLVCGNSGDPLADDQGVDMVCAFVCAHCLEIAEVTHHGIFAGDAVRAEQVAGLARAIRSRGDIGALQHGNMRGF